LLQLYLPYEGRLSINVYNYLGQNLFTLAEGVYPNGNVQFEIKNSHLPAAGAYLYLINFETPYGLQQTKGNFLLIK
jgi:hypothetical protein